MTGGVGGGFLSVTGELQMPGKLFGVLCCVGRVRLLHLLFRIHRGFFKVSNI